MSGHFSTSPVSPVTPLAGDVSPKIIETKSPAAFRTISEVATDLAVAQHVLRFWESKFPQIKPLKRGGGRRYYRPEDVQLINGIKDLLYNKGFTIRGVQKLLKEQGRFPSARSMVPDPQLPASMMPFQATAPDAIAAPKGLPLDKRRAIEVTLNELKAMRQMLKQSGI